MYLLESFGRSLITYFIAMQRFAKRFGWNCSARYTSLYIFFFLKKNVHTFRSTNRSPITYELSNLHGHACVQGRLHVSIIDGRRAEKDIFAYIFNDWLQIHIILVPLYFCCSKNRCTAKKVYSEGFFLNLISRGGAFASNFCSN